MKVSMYGQALAISTHKKNSKRVSNPTPVVNQHCSGEMYACKNSKH